MTTTRKLGNGKALFMYEGGSLNRFKHRGGGELQMKQVKMKIIELMKNRGDTKTGIIIALAMSVVLATGIAMGLFVVMMKSNTSQTTMTAQNQLEEASTAQFATNSPTQVAPVSVEPTQPQSSLSQNFSPPAPISVALAPSNSNVLEKARLEKEFNELRQHMRSNVDDVIEVKWIYDKKTPKYAGLTDFYVYLGQKSNKTWARLRMGFLDTDWVFFQTVIINIDGDIYEISIKHTDKETQVLRDGLRGIREWADIDADEYKNVIKRIQPEKDVIVRFSGNQRNFDVRLLEDQKIAISRIYRLYELFQIIN